MLDFWKRFKPGGKKEQKAQIAIEIFKVDGSLEYRA